MDDPPPPPSAAAADAPMEQVGSVQWVGNATCLIRWGPFTVLTDPNFLHRGQRAYLGHGLTSRRLTEPALEPDEIPALDAVVLSHLHGDHFDRVVRRHLRRDLPIITTPHASRRLQGRHGFAQALGLRTWAAHSLVKNDSLLRVTALPGQHAPGVLRHFLPPVMGTMLELRSPAGVFDQRIYVSGDTLFVSELSEIPRRFPHIALALIHLGATTLPGGVMVTMDHRQGCDLLELLRPDQALPIHLDDYSVFKLNLDDLSQEIVRRKLEHMIVRLRPGETVRLGSKAQ
jgi:L-ascorbate metabolism protein UlaG (beta-lactamase superfamily)